MFSATTVGKPSSSTWLTRYRLRSRLLASMIDKTAAMGRTPCCRPSNTSTATISSGERGARLYVPGRSTNWHSTSPSANEAIFFSTVTPG